MRVTTGDRAAASSVGGVPARRAQPGFNGPCSANATVPTTEAATSARAPSRSPARAGQSRSRRAASAATTPATHAAVSSCSHAERASVPVPRPCSTATGQQAYAAQCTARQARRPSRARSTLVTISATSRSKASAPKPSHSGR